MEKEQVVIVGYGWVGQANALALTLMGYQVTYIDPAEPPHHYGAYERIYAKVARAESIAAVDSPNTVFIVCIGDKVSEDGIQDISLITSALKQLADVQGTVILRSTILPGKLSGLQFDYYFPEYLHEKVAVEECINPYIFVIGKRGTPRTISFLKEFERRALKAFTGTPEEAAFLKYLWNIWNAIRIAFVNEFGNTIALPSSKENLASIERIIDFMFERGIYRRYGRAYDGHCLPKDMRAFVRWYQDQGNDMSMLDGVNKSNAAHMKIQNQYPQMPEWYSQYPERHISAKVALKALWHTFIKVITLSY
ncbi:MAG: hypothetical protein RLZZ283_335 [Candidatus Parcubacteria bacterium]|jgi:UDP-glucose 6-dehydrogenase